MNASDSRSALEKRSAWSGVACLCALVAAVCGCASDPTTGYAPVSTFPRAYSTVAVHIFENTTFDRDIEFNLTDALIREIETRTPYKVTRERRADTILTGRITAVERDQLSKSRGTGLTEEMILSVTVDFVWQESGTERIITERREFTSRALFLPSPPHGEPEAMGRFAVAQQLARDIVDEMRDEW